LYSASTKGPVEVVEQSLVADADAVMAKHNEYVSQGYEGAMIRQNGPYKLKWKN